VLCQLPVSAFTDNLSINVGAYTVS